MKHWKKSFAILVFIQSIWGLPANSSTETNQAKIQVETSAAPAKETKSDTAVLESKDTKEPLVKTDKAVEQEPSTDESDIEIWWLNNLINLLGIIAGALLIVWQLGRQHKNELEIQKENHRENLRLEIYQEFSKIRIETETELVKLGSYVFIIPTYFKMANETVNSGNVPTPVISRAYTFIGKHEEATNSAIELIKLIEKYEIISPELEIFKIAMLSANYDLIQAYTPLVHALVRILPAEVPDKDGIIRIVNAIQLTPEQIEELESIVDNYINAKDDLCCYIFDFNLELQSIFLKGLFQNSVKFREPKDPKFKVISTDPGKVKELTEYFQEETAWGKAGRRADENVARALKN